jgi:hypothetical protein
MGVFSLWTRKTLAGQNSVSVGAVTGRSNVREGTMMVPPVRLLFICIGNTCRSLPAASVASALLGAGVHAESAGISETGRRAAPEAIAVMQERFGIDLTDHRSRHLSKVALAEFEVSIMASATPSTAVWGQEHLSTGGKGRWRTPPSYGVAPNDRRSHRLHHALMLPALRAA